MSVLPNTKNGKPKRVKTLPSPASSHRLHLLWLLTKRHITYSYHSSFTHHSIPLSNKSVSFIINILHPPTKSQGSLIKTKAKIGRRSWLAANATLVGQYEIFPPSDTFLSRWMTRHDATYI
jgi:hypothetical protein